MRERAAGEGFRAILLDVEGNSDEKSFFRALCNQIQAEFTSGEKVMNAFSHRLGKLLAGDSAENRDWRSWLVDTDWQEFADQLLAHLGECREGTPWLILVDELPIFVQSLISKSGPASARQFLYWLRGIRQKHRAIRWFYTGSVGLDAVARRHQIEGALNDLLPVTLEAFDPERATHFLNGIASRRGCRISTGGCAVVFARLGWLSPYYLERVCEDACAIAGTGNEVGAEHFSAAMDDLLELGKRLYWSAWREHLQRNFSEPERGHLLLLLGVVARSPEGVSTNVLLVELTTAAPGVQIRSLIDTLVADGYLCTIDHERYAFRMNLLREWWLRYVTE